jgi:hypothetical protein
MRLACIAIKIIHYNIILTAYHHALIHQASTEGRCWPLHRRFGVRLRKPFFLHQSLPMLLFILVKVIVDVE